MPPIAEQFDSEMEAQPEFVQQEPVDSVTGQTTLIAPDRIAPDRFAPDRFAFVKIAFVRSAFVRFAPDRFAFVRSAPDRFAFVRSTPDRFALDRFAPGPMRYPPIKFHSVGRTNGVPTMPPDCTPVRIAPVRYA